MPEKNFRNIMVIGIMLFLLLTGTVIVCATFREGHTIAELTGNFYLYELTGDYVCIYPSMSPDGSKIAYTAGLYLLPNSADIWVMDSSGWNTKRLTSFGNVFRPFWSPTADVIAFTADGGIWTIESDGSNLTRLTEGPGYYLCSRWSPDGRKIAYFLRPDNNSGFSLWMMDADGNNKRRLQGNTSIHAAWAPDGDKIAVAASQSGQKDFWIVSTEAGNSTSLNLSKLGDFSSPVLSPDWKTIAFDSIEGIRIRNADGSGDTKIIPEHVSYQLDWLPSGTGIVFLSGGNIRVANIDGSGARQLNPETYCGSVSFSLCRDGETIAYDPHGTIRLLTTDGDNRNDPIGTFIDLIKISKQSSRRMEYREDIEEHLKYQEEETPGYKSVPEHY